MTCLDLRVICNLFYFIIRISIQRTTTLTVELGDALPYIYWLRYNPDAWRGLDGELQRVPKTERENRLVRWLEHFECVAPLGIGYAFYDTDETGELQVLSNDDYHPTFANVVENLGSLGRCA